MPHYESEYELLVNLVEDYQRCFGVEVPFELLDSLCLESAIDALKTAIGTRTPLLERDPLIPFLDQKTSGSVGQRSRSDPFRRLRRKMVLEQLSVDDWPVTNRRVIGAMEHVPREEFVPPELRPHAYEDRALPIGHGQTLSQPYIVGLMTELINPRPHDLILEVGTGSGYQAAILAELASHVWSMEIRHELAEKARSTLARLSYTNVDVLEGDGYEGCPALGTFDGIMMSCAAPKIPRPLLRQLKAGGKLIAPLGSPQEQFLYLFIKTGNRLERMQVIPVRFVEMVTPHAETACRS